MGTYNGNPLQTSDSVADLPGRLVKQIRGTGNVNSLDNATPANLMGVAMGVVGASRVVTLTTEGNAGGADATITMWLWHPKRLIWYKGGANTNDSTKVYSEGGWGGWRAPLGALYYFTSSIDVAIAYVDGNSAPTPCKQENGLTP